MNWAAHWERKFTISENISAEVKRRQKRLKKEGKSEEDIAEQVGVYYFFLFRLGKKTAFNKRLKLEIKVKKSREISF